MKANRSSLLRDDAAVSDVVGSVLLVAITVVMAAAFGVTVFTLTKPVDPVAADVSVAVVAGANGWQSGDEKIRLLHFGGEALTDTQTTVRYVLLGNRVELTGTALGSAFSDGTFTIGEVWELTLTIPEGADLEVAVIVLTPGNASQLLAELTSSTSCTTDAVPPFVVSWGETPPDLTSSHPVPPAAGTFVVVATITDLCSGVNDSTPPGLYYKIDTGIENSVTMTESPDNVWTGTIPDLGWSSQAGKTLNYWLSPLTDTAANSGNSSVQGELIDDGSLLTPITTTVNFLGEGTLGATGIGPARDWADSGAEATFTEGGTAGSGAWAVETATGTSWSGLANIGAVDTAYVTTTTNGADLRVTVADPALTPNLGDITKIIVEATVSILDSTPPPNDQFVLKACKTGPAGPCDTGAVHVGTGADAAIQYEVVNGPSYTWNDVRSMALSIVTDKVGNADGTWRVDSAQVLVFYTPYSLDVELTFPAIPTGTSYQLEIGYTATGDDFQVAVRVLGVVSQVCASQLTSGPSFTCSLTLIEVAGPLSIQITDLDTEEGLGTLELEYVRARTTP